MQNEIARAAAARRAQMEIDEEPEIEKHAPEPQETPEFVQAAEILASKRASAASINIPPAQDNTTPQEDAISEDGSYEKVYTTEEGGHEEGGGAYYNKKTDPDSRRHRHRKRHRTREIKPDTGEVERHCTCTIL